MAHVRENGASSGVGVLATYAYDDLGRRTSLTLGDGSSTSYGYDAVSRLTSLGHDLTGTSYDQTLGFSYNPAGQITSNTRSNDNYAWTGHYNVNRGYTANGLNEYSASGSVTPTYDTKGNLTSDGNVTMGYDSENRMTLSPSALHVFYDPLGRMSGVGTTAPAAYYESEGALNVAERTGAGAVGRRHVFGPGGDEPVVWYEGSGTTDRRFYHQDEHGSTVALTDGSGNVLSTTVYDEYGAPRTTSNTYTGRFLYTGQRYFGGFGLYYYKARMYSPTWGRFLQTDPIGYGDGMNWHDYVGSDPVNRTDPSGLQESDCEGGGGCGDPLEVIYTFLPNAAKVHSGSGSQLQPRMPVTGGGDGANSSNCAALQQATSAAAAKANLPPHVTQNKNWDNPAVLQGYQDLYQEHLDQFEAINSRPAQWVIGFGISMIPWARGASAAAKIAAAAAGTTVNVSATAWIESQIKFNQNSVNAVKARIAQINAGC